MEESKTEICMLRRRIAELEKEKQADKEKIKELEAINKMQEYRINKMDIPIAYVIENRDKIQQKHLY